MKNTFPGRVASSCDFSSACQRHMNQDVRSINNKQVWLCAEKTLRAPCDKAYGNAHILLASMQGKHVVIKMEEKDKYFRLRETQVLQYLTSKSLHNVVRYVCSFECTDNEIQRDVQVSPVSDSRNSVYHCLVTDYVGDVNLRDFLQVGVSNENMLCIMQQLAFTILEMYFTYGVTHNDLALDNIMVSKCTPNTILEYNIFDRTVRVRTFDHMPVLIDFDHSSMNESIFATSSNNSSNSNSGLVRYSSFSERIDMVTSLFERIWGFVSDKQKHLIKETIFLLGACTTRKHKNDVLDILIRMTHVKPEKIVFGTPCGIKYLSLGI